MFITKDSGEAEKFTTGYQRDTQKGKTRFDLIPPRPLRRVADLYARGAEKYGESNWSKGAPFMRQLASIYRHIQAWREKIDDGEDHLAAAVWGLFSLMYYENRYPDLDDRDELL